MTRGSDKAAPIPTRPPIGSGKHNADNTNATTFNATNTGLTVPWTFSTPISVSPSSVTFTNGEFIGTLSLLSSGNGVTLTANDGAGHSGTSAAITSNT